MDPMARSGFNRAQFLFPETLNLLVHGAGEVHPRVHAVVLNALNTALHMRHFKDPVSHEAYFLNLDRVRGNLKAFSNRLSVHDVVPVIPSCSESSSTLSSALLSFLSLMLSKIVGTNVVDTVTNVKVTSVSVDHVEDPTPPPLKPTF